MELPEQDKRQYHLMSLPNGLRCLLIHDNETEKAAASVSVAAGQLQDGPEWPGRAHLLEHLIFLGSKKFPEENSMDSYLTQHGGSSNAYTDLSLTCYFMDCIPSALEGALDRWMAALGEPLLSMNVVEREIKAVDSEHAKNKPQDHWRLYQLSKQVIVESTDPNNSVFHPYGSFGTGNLESLLPPVDDPKQKEERLQALRNAVHDFWQTYYHAPAMTLVVCSSHTLDDMQEMVTRLASDLPTSPTEPYQPPIIPPLLPLPDMTSRRIDVVPIRPLYYLLELQWPLRENQSLYRDKPGRILSHLLGHEGPGSLLAALRTNAWVQELVADDSKSGCPGFSIFSLHMELTRAGWEHVNDIIRLVFAYLYKCCECRQLDSGTIPTPPSYVYEELLRTGDAEFRFLAQQGAMDTVSRLSVQMMHGYEEPKHLISGPFKFFPPERADTDNSGISASQNADLWGDLLRALMEHPIIVMVGSPEYQQEAEQNTEAGDGEKKSDALASDWARDPWYGTIYRVSPIEATLLKSWKKPLDGLDDEKNQELKELVDSLHLPRPNEFLAENLDLLPKDSHDPIFSQDRAPPQCISKTDFYQLWYKPDVVFGMPKVNILIQWQFGMQSLCSLREAVLWHVWSEWINELMNDEFAYEASMAGLHGELLFSRRGLELHVSGFCDKAGVLLERLLGVLTAPLDLPDAEPDSDYEDRRMIKPPTGEMWERIIAKTKHQYLAFLQGQPYQHALHFLDACLETPKFTIEERLPVVEQLLPQDLQELHQKNGQWWRSGTQGYLFHSGQILVHGNVTVAQARDFAWIISSAVPSPSVPASPADAPTPWRPLLAEKPGIRVVNLQPPQPSSAEQGSIDWVYRRPAYSPEETNHCLLEYYPIGTVTYSENATLSLLQHLIKEPAYLQLRTQQQLGYIVHSQIKTSADSVKGLLLLVQGEVMDPVGMQERVEAFWPAVRTQIANMTTEEFTSHQKGLAEELKQAKKNLLQESASFWAAIGNQRFEFDRLIQIADHVLTTTQQQVLQMLDKFIVLRRSSKLTVQIFGNANDGEEADGNVPTGECKGEEATKTSNAAAIEDFAEFVRTQPLYPLPASVSPSVMELK